MVKHVNLVKLCVGADGPDDLEEWQRLRFGGGPAAHVTRMWPKREAEVLGGGSLYWVIKGQILARQRVLDLEPVQGSDGVTRCALHLDPEIIRTSPALRRPFQGWRYLAGTDVPPDLPQGRASEPDLPAEIARARAEMGLR